MDDFLRVNLLIEAVRYCQKVKRMGMPASCYTKALREPVHYLWERRSGSKVQSAKYRSKSTIGVTFGKGALVYDHAIPFSLLQKELLDLQPVTAGTVTRTLDEHGTICLITKEEDKRLTKYGYNKKMPAGWDKVERNNLARYEAVGIELVENEDYNPPPEVTFSD